ncbi:MAG TPA: hypothetical protein ACFCUC_05850 [Desulfobacterales bacterium]
MKIKPWSLIGILLCLSFLAACQGTQEQSSPDDDRAPIVEPYKYHPKSNR